MSTLKPYSYLVIVCDDSMDTVVLHTATLKEAKEFALKAATEAKLPYMVVKLVGNYRPHFTTTVAVKWETGDKR